MAQLELTLNIRLKVDKIFTYYQQRDDHLMNGGLKYQITGLNLTSVFG